MGQTKVEFNVTFLMSLTVIHLLTCVSGGNILFHPLTGEGSHYYVQKNLAVELIKRGHNVTILMDAKFEDPVMADGKKEGFNVEIYQSPVTYQELNELNENMTRAGLKGKFFEFLKEYFLSDATQRKRNECVDLLGNKKLTSNLQIANFDLAIEDVISLCPFVQYLKMPYAMVSASAITSIMGALELRLPFNPSYMPEIGTALDHRMCFMDRLENVKSVLLHAFIMSAWLYGPYRQMLDNFGFAEKSLITSLHADTEMWLLNTDFVLDFPKPLLPHMVSVGGLTTRPVNPLSHEWEAFLQSAGDEGVVLFSMGSYATGIDADVAGLFAGAFAQLPQKVIWAPNGKPSVTISPNVKVVDWMPQNDLLAHPQIKVFVFHGGLNGIWEAVYHGVPMVAIPLFGDHLDNAARIVSRGIGVKVDIATLTSDELADDIRTVISNKSYKETATRMSAIFRDRRRTPVEEASDWIEYVIRHGGAKHLRSAALDLNVYQYLLLDVIAVLLVAFLTVFAMLICCCRLCLRECRRVSRVKVKSE